jgi:hypothetical protein
MNELETQQQTAITDKQAYLTELESIIEYFTKKGMKKYRATMRKVINMESAELLLLQNHYKAPASAEMDLKQNIIDDMELEIKKLNKRITDMQNVIDINTAIEKSVK